MIVEGGRLPAWLRGCSTASLSIRDGERRRVELWSCRNDFRDQCFSISELLDDGRVAGRQNAAAAHSFDGKKIAANPHRGMYAGAEDMRSKRRLRGGPAM